MHIFSTSLRPAVNNGRLGVSINTTGLFVQRASMNAEAAKSKTKASALVVKSVNDPSVNSSVTNPVNNFVLLIDPFGWRLEVTLKFAF